MHVPFWLKPCASLLFHSITLLLSAVSGLIQMADDSSLFDLVNDSHAVLSPRLKQLVLHLPGVAAKLSMNGINSVIVLGNRFDDSSEAVDGLSSMGIDSYLAAELFSSCDDLCSGLVSEVSRVGLATPASSPTVESSMLDTPYAVIQKAALQSATTVKSTKGLTKATKAATDLWNLLIECGTFSALATEAKQLNPKLQEEFRRHLIARWIDIPAASLRGYFLTFKKFEAWCSRNGTNPWQASRTIFVVYFSELQSGKPTVALGHFRALSWIATHFEVEWNLQSRVIKDAAAVKSCHVESQVSPMRVTMWLLLNLLSCSTNLIVRGCGLFWMLILHAVLRPAHLQRSRITCMHPQSIEGKVLLGKSKSFGRRRPFYWRCPRRDLLSSDLGERVAKFMHDSGNADRDFFLPDTLPQGAGIHAKRFDTTAMAQSKIRQLTTCIFQILNVPEQIIAQLQGFYAARRVLPTLAHRLKLSVGERVDVGGWASASSKGLAMPQRYSEAKLDEQCNLRDELIRHASDALQSICSHNPAPNQELEVSLSYTNAWKYFAKRGDNLASSTITSASEWMALMLPKIKDMDTAYASTLDDKAPSSSSSSSSSSSNSSSLQIEPPGSDVQWQLSSSAKKGCLHLVVGDDMLACGRTLNRPESGEGLSRALTTGKRWSPRCKAALLEVEQKWWDDSHTTD